MPEAGEGRPPLRVFLATAGSRGDVEPFVALASALRRAGHAVRLAAPDDPVEGDIDVVALGVSFAELGRAVADVGGVRSFREHIRPAMRTLLLRAVEEAVSWQPDVIVAHPKLLTAAVAAERLDIPHLTVELTPVLTPTREFPAAGVLNRTLGPTINRLSYRASGLGERMFRAEIREARQRLGLRAARRLSPAAGSLVAVSPALLPRPADWPSTTYLTGDWRRTSSRAEELDPAVQDFLADDAPFLYAGFGSMRGGDAAARAEAIVAGGRRAGLRVLLATGWGGLEPPRRLRAHDLLVVSSVPHATVLPHAAAAIHHGGAGTVHAVALAGTPSVFVPFLADQPFWARLLRSHGLAGSPLDHDRLSPTGVQEAIAEADTRRTVARRVAERMRAEDGPATAATIIAGVADGAVTS